MKTARLLLGAVLLAALALPARGPAQTTNADNSTPTHAGPVVMPPADVAPPPPDAQTAAQNTAPSAAAPAVPVLPPNATSSATTPKQDDIDDIRPPFFFLRSWLWLWLALAALALLILIILLWKWFRARGPVNPKTAYDLALEKLEQARALMREDDPAPYAVAVSETIRTYLGQRFNAPSSRRTTDEFLRQMENDPSTPLAEHRDLLVAFLRACDLVKFARYQPTLAELEEVHQRAVNFVQATKPVPVAAPAAPPRALPPIPATS